MNNFVRTRVISGISIEVRGFISRYINSVWQLETLLCVKRAGVCGVSISDLVKELYIAEGAISVQLAKFIQDGIIVRDTNGSFRYSPDDVELANTLDILESLYAKRRVAVTDMIYRQSNQSMSNYQSACEVQEEGV